MENFLISNWATLIIAAIFLCYVIFLVVNKKWTKLKQLAFDFIQRAEEIFQGSKRGKEKFEFVFNEVYDLLPVWVRFFVPKSYLKAKLQKWYDIIKNDLKPAKISSDA